MQKNSQRIVTYCCSTVNISTVSSKDCSHLYYREIYLRRYIFCHFPLTYYDSIIFILFYIKLSWNIDFFHKYQICSFVVFLNTTSPQQSKDSINFDLDQQQQVQKPNCCYTNQATTEIKITIGGQSIVVR